MCIKSNNIKYNNMIQSKYMKKRNILKNISITWLVFLLIISQMIISFEDGESSPFNPSASLIISTVDKANEEESFTVLVTIDNEKEEPVENASIVVEWDDNTYLTNVEGKVNLIAPTVAINTVYVINASKESYNSTEVNILIIDTPQLIIDAPSSIVEGETFSVIITIDDGNPVKHALVTFNDVSFLSSISGRVNFNTLFVEEDTLYEITTEKEGYISDQEDIMVINQIVTEPQLIIDAPSSIDEGENFSVIITIDDGNPVKHALVTFNDVSFLSSISGRVKFTAPFVEEDTKYTIIASKEGHTTAVVNIMIINNDTIVIEEDEKGWVMGIVYEETDDSNTPLEGAMVCIIISEENNVLTNKCVFTNQNGEYSISVEPDVYFMEASKSGYIKSQVDNVKVEAGEETNQDFILIKIEEESDSSGEEDGITDYILNEQIRKGNLPINVQATSKEQKVTLYKEDFEAEILEVTDEKVIVRIQGTSTKPQKVAVTVEKLEDIQDIEFKVYYDDNKIEVLSSLTQFFSEDNTETNCIILEDDNGKKVVVINAAEWSEHTITIQTISQVIEAIGGTTAIIMYITTFAILGVLYFAPFFLVRKRR